MVGVAVGSDVGLMAGAVGVGVDADVGVDAGIIRVADGSGDDRRGIVVATLTVAKGSTARPQAIRKMGPDKMKRR